MSLSLSQLRYVILPGECNDVTQLKFHSEAYRLWREVWTATYKEVNPAVHLASDGFTRQTRIGALFNGDECIGLATLRKANFESPTPREDSLLAAWTPEAFEKLVQAGSEVVVCSYLTVAPAYRGEVAPQVILKFLLTDLIALNFLDLGGDVMTGTMRLNRGTEKAAYATGATQLGKGMMFGIESDLVGFYRKDLLTKVSSMNFLARSLWQNRLNLTELGVTNVKRTA